MSSVDDEVFDAALREAVRGEQAPDLARDVARASAAQRAEALALVDRHGTEAPLRGRFRSAWLAAAAVLLGLGVVWAIWSRNAQDAHDAAPIPTQARDPQDPQRVVPKTVEEFRTLLKQTRTIRVRGCYAQVSVGGDMVRVDLDRGDAGYVELSDADRTKVLQLLDRLAEGATIPPKPNLAPGARLRLELKNGTNLQVLTELGGPMRVYADRDIRRSGNELGNLLAGYMGTSFDRAAVELGVVVGGINTRLTTPEGNVYRYPSTLERLELYDSPTSVMTQDIARFADLRELDVRHSSDSMIVERLSTDPWSQAARDVLGGLQIFRAAGLRFSDPDLARLVGDMQDVEVLELESCPHADAETLIAVLQLGSLKTANLRGCSIPRDVIEEIEQRGVGIVRVPATATIELDKMNGWSDDDRRRLQGLLPCRIEWTP